MGLPHRAQASYRKWITRLKKKSKSFDEAAQKDKEMFPQRGR